MTNPRLLAFTFGRIKRLIKNSAKLDRPHDADCAQRIQTVCILHHLPLERKSFGCIAFAKRDVINNLRYVIDSNFINTQLGQDLNRKFCASFFTIVKLCVFS